MRLSCPCLVFAALLLPALALAQQPDSVIVETPAGQSQILTGADLANLPQQHLDVSFATDHGPRHSSFTGPLLWTVLTGTGAIDAAKPKDHVRQTITATGADDYTAILALGEIDPDFENKPVLLAEDMDGKPLARPRLVVPGDQHGGRSVHDVIKLRVTQP